MPVLKEISPGYHEQGRPTTPLVEIRGLCREQLGGVSGGDHLAEGVIANLFAADFRRWTLIADQGKPFYCRGTPVRFLFGKLKVAQGRLTRDRHDLENPKTLPRICADERGSKRKGLYRKGRKRTQRESGTNKTPRSGSKAGLPRAAVLHDSDRQFQIGTGLHLAVGRLRGWEAADPREFTGRPGISQVSENGILSAYVSLLAASK